MHPVTLTRAYRMVANRLATWIEPVVGATGYAARRRLKLILDSSGGDSASEIEASGLFRGRCDRGQDPGCSFPEAVRYVRQRSPYRWGKDGH
jgi:hypothetical protein